MLHSEAFQALWDRIKQKTTYRVQFDNDKLIADCIRSVAEIPRVARARAQVRMADIKIDRTGVKAEATSTEAPIALSEHDIELPDILTFMQNGTNLTRRSLVAILVGSGRLDDFVANPQQFIAFATEAIKRTMRLAIVDGIRYQRVGADDYYAQELFEHEELLGYLTNSVPSTKSVYERVIYDSAGIEKSFAEQLEANTAVKVYAKLPDWFKIPTPLGTYNPDWAIVVDEGGVDRVYLVVETKGSLFQDDLRNVERAKIACGKAHFAELARNAPFSYIVAKTLDDVFVAIGADRVE